MNSNLKLLPAALLVAVLAMAGCGGGGSGDTTTEPTEPTEPAPPASVEQLSLDIQAAVNKAVAADEMAKEALANAKKYSGMLTTEETAGSSKTAMMAAEAILKAEMDIGTALMNAEAAKMAADAAKMTVMALPDDHPHKAALMTTVDRAVMDAEMYVTAIKAINEGTDLEDYVALVEGTDGKGTPRSIANSVGEAISAALALDATNTNGLGRAQGAHGTTAPDGTVDDELKLVMDDAKGKTWAEMVGADNLMTMPIGTSNAGVQVASISGMDVTKVWAAEGDRPTGAIADGSSHANANYMGIPGAVHCLGTDCKVTDGELMGSWYFAVDAAQASTHYVRNPDRVARRTVPYVAETLYASYGHWLVVSAEGAATVSTFATTGGDGTNSTIELGANDDLGDKATYSGGAVGMSSRTQGSGDDETTDSGRFTADVTLNASFGTTPTVRGTINNFQGDATNSGWSVTLESATLAGTQNTGIAVTDGRDGTWSAQAYGTGESGGDPVRPTGIFGGFSVHFSDGDAAGAYATRKD
ncbi:MAG: hypothetical protein OXH76_16410 [Boseongicola sp.]|nr:hypothetical protein [Boseongicola sp.]